MIPNKIILGLILELMMKSQNCVVLKVKLMTWFRILVKLLPYLNGVLHVTIIFEWTFVTWHVVQIRTNSLNQKWSTEHTMDVRLLATNWKTVTNVSHFYKYTSNLGVHCIFWVRKTHTTRARVTAKLKKKSISEFFSIWLSLRVTETNPLLTFSYVKLA